MGRDVTRVGTKFPLVNKDDWRRLQGPTPPSWGECVRYEPDMRWGYVGALDQAHDIQVAGALEIAVSRTNSLLRSDQGPSGNEISPIGDRSPEPTPGIGRQ